MVKIIGISSNNFKNDKGENIPYYRIYVGQQDNNVVGYRVKEFKLSNKLVETANNLLGCDVDIYFNEFGKVSQIKKVDVDNG